MFHLKRFVPLLNVSSIVLPKFISSSIPTKITKLEELDKLYGKKIVVDETNTDLMTHKIQYHNWDHWPILSKEKVHEIFSEELKWRCPESLIVYKIKHVYAADDFWRRGGFVTLNELYFPELGLSINGYLFPRFVLDKYTKPTVEGDPLNHFDEMVKAEKSNRIVERTLLTGKEAEDVFSIFSHFIQTEAIEPKKIFSPLLKFREEIQLAVEAEGKKVD